MSVFHDKLRALGFADYTAYTRSPQWRTKRRAYYADEHTPKACICGASNELDLHHLTYERLGDEAMEDLHPLCRTCHAAVHRLARRGLMRLDLQGYVSDLRRARYARERREALARAGATEDWPEEAHDPVVWDFNARVRHRRAIVAEEERLRPQQTKAQRRERARRASNA